ncbi:MAG: PorT family protein, partial [Muribaculaceae bacterium]|nr:PorT family protein [Muribaculaceae bacterium]
MKDNWIDDIRDKMMEHEVTPPDGLLASVMKEMQARKVRKKRWIFSACAASVALLAGICAVYFTERIEYKEPRVAGIAPAKIDKEGKNTGSQTSSVGSEKITDKLAEKHTEAVRESDREATENDRGDVAVIHPKSQDDPLSQGNEDNNCEDISPEEFAFRRESDSAGNDYLAYVDLKNHDNNTGVSVSISTSANGLGGMFNGSDASAVPRQNTVSLPLTRMGGGGLANSPTNNIQPSFVEVFDHKLPLRFSLDFSFPVYKDLSIGSGITYTYLRSDISYGYSDSRLMKAHQNLHFLGIPVNLRYTPLHFRNLDIYVSAGLMAEKCLAGEIKEDEPVDAGYSYPGCDERPFQFSGNAAAGVQYNLSRQCGVYM